MRAMRRKGHGRPHRAGDGPLSGGVPAGAAGHHALPGLNGLEVLRRIRRENESLPVILLTARDTTMDKVSGLTPAPTTILPSPFAIEELLARIRARPAEAAQRKPEQSGFTVQGSTWSPDSRKVTVNGEEVELTRKEFDLLRCLMEHQGKVMNRLSC